MLWIIEWLCNGCFFTLYLQLTSPRLYKINDLVDSKDPTKEMLPSEMFQELLDEDSEQTKQQLQKPISVSYVLIFTIASLLKYYFWTYWYFQICLSLFHTDAAVWLCFSLTFVWFLGYYIHVLTFCNIFNFGIFFWSAWFNCFFFYIFISNIASFESLYPVTLFYQIKMALNGEIW